MSLGRLDFTLHDPRIRKVRRLLAAEQFRNEKIRRLASLHQVTAVEALNRAILTRLMEAGKVKRCDPALLAFEFTAPVTVMIALIDREPEREEEAMARIRAHMAHFIEVYGTEA